MHTRSGGAPSLYCPTSGPCDLTGHGPWNSSPPFHTHPQCPGGVLPLEAAEAGALTTRCASEGGDTPPCDTHTLSLCPAVGQPIPVSRSRCPTEEEVDHYHALYVEALQQLFEAHKGSCGLSPSQRLTVM